MKCPACPDPRHTGGCAVVLKLVERIERLEERNRLYRDRLLVTDRYGAYNKTWAGDHQYCFAHLLRLCQDVGEEHPEDAE